MASQKLDETSIKYLTSMEFYQPPLRYEGRLCLFHNSQLHCGIICFLCHKSGVQRANTNYLSAQEALTELRRKLTTRAHVDNRERVPQMPGSVPSDHGFQREIQRGRPVTLAKTSTFPLKVPDSLSCFHSSP